jgi:hypothetical protein
MNEIDHFKVFVFCSGNVTTDVSQLQENSLVGLCYIVIDDLRASLPHSLCKTSIMHIVG